MILGNFLSSGFLFQSNESELKLKYQFFNSLLLINILIVSLAAILRFYQGEYFQTIIDSAYSLLALITLLLARKSREIFPLLVKFVMLFSLLIVTLTFYNSDNAYVGIGWFYVQMLVVFFLSDRKFSFSMLFLSVVIILGIEFYHADSEHFRQSLMGLLPFIVFNLFIGLYEKRNRMQNALLKEQNKLLEKYSFEIENYDIITRLPNRKLFIERLKNRILIARKYHHEFAVLLIDIDNFKDINDSYGHLFGDRVLLEIARRLENILWEQNSLSKVGTDEFIVILSETDSDKIIKLSKQIQQTVEEELIIDKQKLFISVSLGIALYPKDATTALTLIQNVDSALHKAKSSGKGHIQFYDPVLTAITNNKLSLLTELKQAIKQHKLEVHYQPQIDARDKRVIGMEALIRWQHTNNEFISPLDFIPAAEEYGLIYDIDYFVMKTAMQDFMHWQTLCTDIGKLSLNLSIKLLEDDTYIGKLKAILSELDFKPQWLKLEVTENLVIKDLEQSIRFLKAVRELGIEIAIDDFGTGYSSLSYLQQLPVNKVKIDRSFIINLPEQDAELTRSIIDLSHSLGLDVIAEGIENKAQEKFLLKNNCFLMQGFFYSKALNAEAMKDYLSQHCR